MHSLLIHSWLKKNEPWGLEDFFCFFFLLRDSILTVCAGLTTLCDDLFSCLRLSVYSVLFKHVCHMASGQSHC